MCGGWFALNLLALARVSVLDTKGLTYVCACCPLGVNAPRSALPGVLTARERGVQGQQSPRDTHAVLAAKVAGRERSENVVGK